MYAKLSESKFGFSFAIAYNVQNGFTVQFGAP